MAAAALLRSSENRAQPAHDPVHIVETHRPQVPLRAGHPAAAIVEERESAQAILAPRRAHLRGIPTRVRIARQPFAPNGKSCVEDLFEDRAFSNDEFHLGIRDSKLYCCQCGVVWLYNVPL